MRTRQLLLVGTVGLGSLGAVGACGAEGEDCGNTTCIDSATVTVTTVDGTWQAGEYELTVTSNSLTHNCSVTLPTSARGAEWSCDSNQQVSLLPSCTDMRERSATFTPRADPVAATGSPLSCAAVPGQFRTGTSFPGVPPDFEIRISRDQRELLNERRSFTYESWRPNGSSCDPVCRRADVVLTLPDDPP